MADSDGGVDISQVVDGLAMIRLTFAAEVRRSPSSAELAEVLTWAIKALKDDELKDVHPSQVVALEPLIKKGAELKKTWGGSEGARSQVGCLNDTCFIAATDFLADLCKAMRAETGELPTLKSLTDLLTKGVQASEPDLLADVRPVDMRGLKAEVSGKKKISVRAGNVVAIPAKNGRFVLALVLAKNRFGVAYGLLEGTTVLRPAPAQFEPRVRKHPIYSDDEQVAAGRWPIIDQRDDWLALFPAEPEIFHCPREGKVYAKIGPFGSGETASGKLRDLTREEATELGILDKTYVPIKTPAAVEAIVSRDSSA